MSRRYLPNIIVTGTPGCGKTSHAQSLVSQLSGDVPASVPAGKNEWHHYAVSDEAKSRGCIDSYDERLDTSVVDEDKLLDSLEPDMEKGGAIIDWHCCEVFPERLIDLVVCLRCDNTILFDRLKKRNYNEVKIQENIDCEIMEVIAQEARDSYVPEIVIELTSNNADEMDDNVDRICQWVTQWIGEHPEGVTNELQPRDDDDDDDEE
ncbi:adenylate kinase isoenzyme 6 homolog Fap7p [Diutina catenulata]